MEIVKAHVKRRREEREREWGPDVTAMLAEAGRKYEPEEFRPE